MQKRIQNVSARVGYDLWSPTYDQTPNPVVAMDSRHSVSLLEPRPDELILDAGCGTGRNLQALKVAGSRPVGVDFSVGMLSVAARNHPKIPLAMADLHQPLPFESGVFDAVLCGLIGEHLTDLVSIAAEFRRVLKARGRLVFSAYHPAMAEAGKEANFELSGVEYRLGAVRHNVDHYETAIAGADFSSVERFEFKGDRQLAVEVAAAAKYVDFPVLLVVRALK